MPLKERDPVPKGPFAHPKDGPGAEIFVLLEIELKLYHAIKKQLMKRG